MYKVLTLKWEGGLEQAKLAVKQLFLLNGFPKTDRRLTFNYYFVPGNNELRPGPRQKHYFLFISTKSQVITRKKYLCTICLNGKVIFYFLPIV